jgi:hypothetical protein
MLMQIEIEIEENPTIEQERKIEECIRENTKISKPYKYEYKTVNVLEYYGRG